MFVFCISKIRVQMDLRGDLGSPLSVLLLLPKGRALEALIFRGFFRERGVGVQIGV